VKSIIPVLILTLAACSDKGSDTGVGDDASTDCDVTIDETIPAANATDAYYRNAIEFQLDDEDATAVLSIDGVDGTSTLSEDMETVVFTPSAPLAASTSYTSTLDYCNEVPASITFQTSELGGAVDPSSLVGRAYALDLSSGRIVIPEGVGEILGAYLEYTIFLSVTDAGTDLNMIGALANEDDPSMQDYCAPTLDFPTADFSEAPYFQIGPETTTLAVAGYSITIDDLLVSGDFAPDGTWVGGAQLAGSIDTRPLVSLLDDDPEAGEDTVCELVAGFGVECIPCSDGGDFCLDLLVLDLVAEEAGVAVEIIDAEDCHASCPDSVGNPECPEFYTGK